MKRVLCLRFSKDVASSWGEAFLRWSPLVATRAPGFVFCEISQTASLFGGEESVRTKALALAEKIAGDKTVRAAIGETPYEAQIFTSWEDPPPIESLRDLEGLTPWARPREIENVIEFFRTLGFRELGELRGFPAEAFRERWGSLGTTLWKRLHGKEIQIISPLSAADPLYAYLHFENAPTHVDPLLRSIEPLLEQLFARLAAMGRFAKVLEVVLHCEYSGAHHHFRIEPVAPGRDRGLFTDLLAKKIAKMDLENPLKEAEIFIEDVAEKLDQLDFFEPRETTRERWERFMSFASLMNVKVGFLEKRPGLYPEQTVSFTQAEITTLDVRDTVESAGEAVRLKPAYAKGLQDSPRPALLLKEPRPLPESEIHSLRFLTNLPVERLVGEWWKEEQIPGRDYYIALTVRGRILWVFRDPHTKQYFLHGAFD